MQGPSASLKSKNLMTGSPTFNIKKKNRKNDKYDLTNKREIVKLNKNGNDTKKK